MTATTKHPLSTTAGLRRALKPGTAVRITNHVREAASRVTTVHAKTNTRDLVTYATNAAGAVVPSHTAWPKAAQLDPDPEYGNVVTIRNADGSRFLTLVILSTDADVPAEYKAGSEVAA